MENPAQNKETIVVLATENRGKEKEMRDLLAGRPWQLRSLRDYPELRLPPETGETFLENARIKARFVASATGCLAIGDDSGLEVDALSGAPGVYSARFAGEDKDSAANNAKLLREMEGVPTEKRTARFRCVIVVAAPDGRELSCEGSCEGRISEAPAGSDGFGYDPLLYLPELGRTMAELSLQEKNGLSHRSRALRAVLPALDALLEADTAE